MPSSQSQSTLQTSVPELDQLSQSSSSSIEPEAVNTDIEVQLQPNGKLTSDPSEAVRQLKQHLEELQEAPREHQKRRRSRRLQKALEDRPIVQPSTPRKGGRVRRTRLHSQHKKDQLVESQISDSQLLQVTYDDPEGRREKAKLLARIERSVSCGSIETPHTPPMKWFPVPCIGKRRCWLKVSTLRNLQLR